MRPPRSVLAILLAIAGAAFLPAVDGQFQYDDFRTVQTSRRVLQPGQFLAATSPADLLGPGRPVTDLLLGAVRAVGGAAPRPFHLASLLLHLATAALVFRLASRILTRLAHPRAGPLATVVATLFAVHPLQTEAVCYASQVSEILAAALGLLSLLLLLDAEEQGSAARAWGFSVGAAALLLLALGAKAVVVAVPAAFLLIALGAVPAAGDRTGGRSGRTLLLAVPSLVVAAAAVARNLLSLEVEGSTAGLSAGVGP